MTAERMWYLSSRFYYFLSELIGTSEVLKMRREIADLETHLQDTTVQGSNLFIRSGSNREGFRFCGSDIDVMMCRTDTKIIYSFLQIHTYSVHVSARMGLHVLLAETCYSRPGFALLQVISRHVFRVGDPIMLCVRLGGKSYLSSSKVKSFTLSSIFGSYNYYPHGPCATGVFDNKDIDIAFSLKSDDWPPLALDFLNRCRSSHWPSSSVLQNIVEGGCHFVPIGAKNSGYENHEWRMSFSVAETKLIYSLNHTQFLCYGLLKLFLKEVINKDIENPLLCSYFMKTAVFWEIQIGCINIWCPQNILLCFWKCFKHIIKWVYLWICPNFFISNNNMFYGKEAGVLQRQLLEKLYSLYDIGVVCILKSESINSIVNSTYRLISLDNEVTMSESDFHSELIREVSYALHFFNITESVDLKNVIKLIDKVLSSDLSQCQTVAMKAIKVLCQDLLQDKCNNK